jgi:hypothetical protein
MSNPFHKKVFKLLMTKPSLRESTASRIMLDNDQAIFHAISAGLTPDKVATDLDLAFAIRQESTALKRGEKP